MATYVIGDLQGCFAPLTCLLNKIGFEPSRDEIWLAGDLVNRGPASLACLEWARENAAQVVLGNHDLHLLALYYGEGERHKKSDTLAEVLGAPNASTLMDWLRHQAMLYHDASRNLVLTHAGVPHIWTIEQAIGLAEELQALLRSGDYGSYFSNMYGNRPARWSDGLVGMERARAVTNYFTRMRFIQPDGTLDFDAKEGLDSAPEGFEPWFRFPRPDQTRVIFGHWAALQGDAGHEQFWATDTGCVWGGKLTAINVDTEERIACDCDG